MGKSDEFNYYYGVEAEQYSFYRVPRLLIKNTRFKGLSSDAKLLYGLMLDRMSLSMKNGWLDEENRVYICYTMDNIMEDLGCAKEKCTKILAELDSKKGIGLIEKKRRGLGKPDIIYVKNFATIDVENDAENITHVESDYPHPEMDHADNSTEVRESNLQKFENRTSRGSKIELAEVRKPNLQKFENQTYRSSETELAEVRKPNSNYTDINYTDISYNNHIHSNHIHSMNDGDGGGTNKNDPSVYMEIIRKNIAYDRLLSNLEEADRKRCKELYELICEIVCVKKESVWINSTEYPYEYVRERFLQLTSSHLEYVISCLNKTVTKITRMRAYMLTVLFNSLTTMENGFQQEVQYDMYGGGWEEKGIL